MGIAQSDLDGRILEPNPALEALLGYSREELRGMPVRNLMQVEDADRYSRAFQDLVDGKREACELEVKYQGKGAASGWIHLKISLVRGPEEEPQFAIGMAEDITGRKRSEQRLREAQKMEGDWPPGWWCGPRLQPSPDGFQLPDSTIFNTIVQLNGDKLLSRDLALSVPPRMAAPHACRGFRIRCLAVSVSVIRIGPRLSEQTAGCPLSPLLSS